MKEHMKTVHGGGDTKGKRGREQEDDDECGNLADDGGRNRPKARRRFSHV